MNYICNLEDISNIQIRDDNKLINEYPNNWVLWGRLNEGKPTEIDSKGKINKCPINPTNLFNAKADKKTTWGTFNQVKNKYNHKDYAGAGIQLKDTKLIAIDIDNCIDEDNDNRVNDMALDIITTLDTYFEISPSKLGIRALIHDVNNEFELKKEGYYIKNPNNGLEIYNNTSNRYVTLTGHLYDEMKLPINSNIEGVKKIQEKYMKRPVKENNHKPKEDKPFNNTNNNEISPKMTNDEILNIMRRVKNKDKFVDIFDNGNCNNGDSETDQVLMNLLYFYTQDEEQLKELFFMSKHHIGREKENKGLEETKEGQHSFNECYKKAKGLITNVYVGRKKKKVGIPKNWIEKNNSLYFIKKELDQQTGEEVEKEIYIGEFVDIVGKAKNHDNEFSFIININNHNQIVPFNELMTKSKLINALSRFELTINDYNAKNYIQYISDFSKLNRTSLPQYKLCNQLGWNEDKFISYDDTCMLPNKLKLMIKTKGNFEAWKNEIIKLRENKFFRFIFNLYTVSVLLPKLGQRNFVIHHYGMSRTGKTALAYACLSIWGNPYDLEVKYDSTLNAFEDKAFELNNIPLYIDEGRGKRNDKKTFADIVYLLGNGKGKGRCNKDGTLKDEKTWNCLIFSSAEMKLTTDYDMEGVNTRSIELNKKTFDNEDQAKQVYKLINGNYGFGEKFIETMNKIDLFDIDYKLNTNNNNKLTTHIDMIELAILGDYIANITLEGNADIEDSKNCFKEMLNELEDKRSFDITDNMFDWLNQMITRNKKDIQGLNTYTINDLKGKFDDKTGTLRILSSVVKEWCDKSNWDYNVLKERLTKSGLVEYNKPRVGGKTQWCFVLDYVKETENIRHNEF